MIPTMLKIHINKVNGKKFRIVFPVIILWILLFAFILLFAPFMILLAALTWPFGYGKIILFFPVMLYSLIASLKDLLIDITNNKETVYISFY
jgi:hypothetical protein